MHAWRTTAIQALTAAGAALAPLTLSHFCLATPLLQGLDDAFVSQAPIIEHEQFAEDLYDPSDPTDRQQIEWRETPRAGAAPVGGEAASVTRQQEQQEVPAVAQGNGSPAKPASTAGEAVSTASDHTGAAASEVANGSAKQLTMPAQLQKDAFLVFRALCKLSIRSTDAAPGSEATTIRGKVRCMMRQSLGRPVHAQACLPAALSDATLMRLVLHLVCPFSQLHFVALRTAQRCQNCARTACLPSASPFSGAGFGAAENPAREQRPPVPDEGALCVGHQAVPLPVAAEELPGRGARRAPPLLLHLPHPHGQVPEEPEGGDRRVLPHDPAAPHRAAGVGRHAERCW